jgi:hypothetical protein
MKNNFFLSLYLQSLQDNSEHFQSAIEGLLEKYQVQPVGNGFIDLIIEKEKSLNLIDELSGLSVAVGSLSWWCHSTDETKSKYGCPHGMGGSLNRYGEGIFSECVQHPIFEVPELTSQNNEKSITPQTFSKKCNEVVVKYIVKVLPTESFYSPCLYPGLWLLVPENWRRKYYWT